MALAEALKSTGFAEWFGELLAGEVGGGSPVAVTVLLGLVYFLTMVLFSQLTAHIAALAGVFLTLAAGAGAPPLLALAVFSYFSSLCGLTTPWSSGPVIIYFGFGYVGTGRWMRNSLAAAAVQLAVWLDDLSQLQRHVRVRRHERLGQDGNRLLDPKGPDLRLRPAVSAAQEHEVRRLREIRHQGRPLSSPQEVDLEEVHLGAQKVPSLAAVALVGVVTGALVHGREDLDGRDQRARSRLTDLHGVLLDGNLERQLARERRRGDGHCPTPQGMVARARDTGRSVARSATRRRLFDMLEAARHSDVVKMPTPDG